MDKVAWIQLILPGFEGLFEEEVYWIWKSDTACVNYWEEQD